MNDNQTADDPCKRFSRKLGVIKNVGIIKRLPAGIYGNGYRRSLDVYLNVGKEADYEMEQLKESEDN